MSVATKRKRLLLFVLAFGMICQYLNGCGVNNSEASHIPAVLGDLVYSNDKNEMQYTVYLAENEGLVPYYVLTNNYSNKGNCLLLRKNVLNEMSIYNQNGVRAGYYENSAIDRMLNQDFVETFSDDLADLITTTEIIITCRESLHGGGDEVTEIQRKVFLLSATEVGHRSGRTILYEGESLEFFSCEERRIAYSEDGEPVSWWLRTPCTWYDNVVCGVGESGIVGIGGVGSYGEDDYVNGVRPAFCLAANIPIYLSAEGYYVLDQGNT